jgi:hypothetical protein
MGRVARAPADARHTAQGEEDGGPLPLPSRAYAHAPIPPRIPLRMRSSAYMRVPVSHHARVSVCVCARARLGGRVRERNADGGWGQRLTWGGPLMLKLFLAHLAAHEAARVVAEAEWGAD